MNHSNAKNRINAITAPATLFSKANRMFCSMLLILLSTGSFGQIPLVAPADNGDFSPCVQLLKDGLRDVYTTNDHASLFSDSKRYFSSDEFVNDYHSGKWNGGISVVIEGVPLGLSAGASDEDLHTFQKKIRVASSVVVDLKTYSTVSRSTINVDLANKFNDCIIADQKYGLSIDLNGSDDKTASITINYRPLSSDDPKPTIASISLVGVQSKDYQKIINGDLKTGKKIPDHLSFTAIRLPKQDLLIAVNTSNGLSIIKRLEFSDEETNGSMPIGTVISSLLDFDSFSKLTKSNGSASGIWSPVKSKWAPCDGRSVVGSRYQVLWAGALGPNLPDLRGVFLRGLNKFDELEASGVNAGQANPAEPIRRNEVQPDAVGRHSHAISMRTGYMLALDQFNPPTPPVSIFVGDRPAYNNSYGTLTAQEIQGSNETRPKNVSVFYYIRIN